MPLRLPAIGIRNITIRSAVIDKISCTKVLPGSIRLADRGRNKSSRVLGTGRGSGRFQSKYHRHNRSDCGIQKLVNLVKFKIKRILIGELSVKRFVRSTILVVILTYIGLLMLGVFFADRIIFQPPRTEYRDTKQTIKLRSHDGKEISAVYISNPQATYTILFSHGNAEDLNTLASSLVDLKNMGFSVFAYDYHGYGTSGGRANEQNAYEDENAAYEYLVQVLHIPSNRIIAFGRSLGGAMAIDLAARTTLAGLVVESSFLSAYRVVTHFPILPFDKFKNLDKIKNVHCPTLVIHGRRDQVVAFWHGERLFELANNPKMNLWVDGAGHNDVPEIAGSKYVSALQTFRDSLNKMSTTAPAN
jgi:pimeloyl-ACP methyl ester carboxylesterase